MIFKYINQSLILIPAKSARGRYFALGAGAAIVSLWELWGYDPWSGTIEKPQRTLTSFRVECLLRPIGVQVTEERRGGGFTFGLGTYLQLIIQ